MDGMTQLVRQGGYIVRSALVINQHPGSDVRGNGSTEGSAHFSMAHLAIQMVLFKYPARQFFNPGLEIVECIKNRLCCLVESVHFIGFNHRGVDITTS